MWIEILKHILYVGVLIGLVFMATLFFVMRKLNG